jgi:hypothetical protein
MSGAIGMNSVIGRSGVIGMISRLSTIKEEGRHG